MAHELRDEFAGLVDEKLKQKLVTIDDGGIPVFNTRYEGLPSAGAVKIPVTNKMTVRTYDKQNGIAPTAGTTSYITVTFESEDDKAVNEIIDNYDEASLPFDIIADRLANAGEALAVDLDTNGLYVLADEGTLVSEQVVFTVENLADYVIDRGAEMDEAGVPQEGRYVIVNPMIHKIMLKDKENYIKQSDLGQEIVMQGYVGQYFGFYVKNTAYVTAQKPMIFGHSVCATRVRTWTKTPDTYNLDNSSNYVGASAVKGRTVRKHKVTKPEGILVANNLVGVNTDIGVTFTSGTRELEIDATPGANAKVYEFTSTTSEEFITFMNTLYYGKFVGTSGVDDLTTGYTAPVTAGKAVVIIVYVDSFLAVAYRQVATV